MTDKNPYENQDSVDIPDFSSLKSDDTTSDIDRSIFNMDDDEDDEEFEEEEEVVYRKVKQPVIIATAIVLVILLILSIVALVYGLNKKAAYNDLKVQYETYQTNAAAKEADLNNQIATLKKQIEEAANANKQDTTNATKYVVVANSIRVRSGAGASNSFADYDKLPDAVKQLCTKAGDEVFIGKNATLDVLETKTEAGTNNVWGKIADNAWVCLNYGGEEWAAKK